MWYEYFANSSLLTDIYTQVPSLETFLLLKLEWQPESAIIRLCGDLSQFPDASSDWQPPYNTLQVTLELNIIKIQEFSITKPPLDLVVNITVNKSEEQHMSLRLTSPQCVLHVYFHTARIISISKYICDPESW